MAWAHSAPLIKMYVLPLPIFPISSRAHRVGCRYKYIQIRTEALHICYIRTYCIRTLQATKLVLSQSRCECTGEEERQKEKCFWNEWHPITEQKHFKTIRAYAHAYVHIFEWCMHLPTVLLEVEQLLAVAALTLICMFLDTCTYVRTYGMRYIFMIYFYVWPVYARAKGKRQKEIPIIVLLSERRKIYMA